VSKCDRRREALRARILLEAPDEQAREKPPVTVAAPVRDPRIRAMVEAQIVTILDLIAFEYCRRAAAWIGLTPKDHSTAGKVSDGRCALGGMVSAAQPHPRRTYFAISMASR